MKERFKRLNLNSISFLLPTVFWLFFFVLCPFVIIFIFSFAMRGTYGGIQWVFTFDNFERAWDWLYLGTFISSLKWAVLTSVCCLLLGYPFAYGMARSSKKIRNALMFLILIPFWTNLVVRVFAIKILLLSIDERLLNTPLAVWVGMISTYIPLMIIPLYLSLEKMDWTLTEAAADLGATPFQVLYKIVIPQTSKGILTGCLFVFAPALGEFVIPDLLGGAKILLYGNVITDQFLKSRDWPFGSALSVIFILVVFGALFFEMKKNEELL